MSSDITGAVAAMARRPMVILTIGWLFVIVYSYPGLMSFDSIEQLDQARERFYTDGHPPLMAVIWRFADAVVAGPLGMLVLQTVTFMAGLYRVLRRAMTPTRAAIVACVIFILPPVLAPMAVIWKDSLMAGLLMMGMASLLEGKPWSGTAWLGLASAVRYNAPAATFPLFLILFVWPNRTRLARYSTAIAAWVAVTVVSIIGVGALLTDEKMHLWQRSIALYDIAGTLAEVDEPIPDDTLRDTLAGTAFLVDTDIHAAIKRVYRPDAYEKVISGDLWKQAIVGKATVPQSQVDAVERAFWDVVTKHPGAYLRHRLAAFAHVNGFDLKSRTGIVMTHRIQFTSMLTRVGASTAASKLQTYLHRKVTQVSTRTPLFRPWIYVVISLLFLPLCLRANRDVGAILLSGLGVQSSLILLAATSDYRYSHWLVTCACVAAAMLIARRARVTESRSRAVAAAAPH